MFMPVFSRSIRSIPPIVTRRPHARIAVLVAVAAVVGAACGSDDTDSGEREPRTSGTPATDPSSTDPPATPIESTSSDADEPVDETTRVPTTASDIPSSTPVDGRDLGPTAQRLLDIAVADLVARLDLPGTASPISVVAVEEVTWRDSSIGCPMKDMQYAQVLTPGTRIVLEHDGRRYSYHAGGGRDPFYCATPRMPVADG